MGAFISANLFLCIIFVILIIIFIGFELSQSKSQKFNLSLQDAIVTVNRNHGVYMDIRNAEEYNAKHILGAINTPFESIENSLKKLKKLQKKPIIIYNNANVNAQIQKAILTLQQNDFENVFALNGGLAAWTKEGFPIESK